MYDLEEQEKIDALKAWWSENGKLVIVAVLAAVLAAAAVSGWRYYKDRQNEQASQLYASLEKAVRSRDAKQVRELSTQIMDQHGGTVYGPMAALVAAKTDFDAGDLSGASQRLAWVIEHARDDETQAVARVRLASVCLDEKKYDEALRLLGQAHPESFDAVYADLRGDVLVAQGKLPEAKAAYRQALEKLGAQSTLRLVVQAKLDGIGGAN